VESKHPKIELPHPGTSYNPDYDDHQALLLKAHEAELKKLQKEEKELKKLKESVQKMTWKQIEDLWLEEMSLNQLLDAKKEGDEISELVQSLTKKSSPKDKKTKQRKRKQLMQKIKEKQSENKKKFRAQQSEIYRIKSLLKEINAKEKEVEAKKAQKELDEKQREMYEPKRLGKQKFQEADLDVKLSDELSGNLRSLKPEGNILMDSYKQMQKRNIIEPREKAKTVKKKFWKKVFDKRNAYEKTHYIK